MPKGMLISIYRHYIGGKAVDNTDGGVSSRATKALLLGPGIPEIFESRTIPVMRLDQNADQKTARLVPVDLLDAGVWTRFGGNFGYSPNEAFTRAVEAIYGSPFYGAVPIHDRSALATRLSEEQIHALVLYVHEHGRTWKSRLRSDWESGRCSRPLQQLRNIGGPSWLKSVSVNTVNGTVACDPLPVKI